MVFSFEMEVFEAKRSLYGKEERAVFHSVETFLRSRHPEVARNVKEHLERAQKVEDVAEKVKEGEANEKEIRRAVKLIEKLEKKRKKLLEVEFINEEYRRQKIEEENRQKLFAKAKQQQRELELAKVAAEQEEEAAFRERRVRQLRFAGDASAKYIQFSQLQLTEHAGFRCNDRLESMTISQLLEEIDNANVFYRLYRIKEVWEVQVYPLKDTRDEDGQKEELTLILDKDKTKIITILRDDKNYDYEKGDRSYAPAGVIARQRNCEIEE